MSADLRQLLEGRMSVTLGTRDEGLHPHFARALAFRVGPAEDEGTIFLSTALADEVVADLRANGRIAVALTNMDNLHARQLKGTVVSIADADEADAPYIHTMRDRSVVALTAMCGEGVGGGYARIPEHPMLAITMKIAAIFDQTPRQGAGAQIA